MKKVSYLMNADADPTNLNIKGYLSKNKDLIEKQSGFVLKNEEPPFSSKMPDFDIIHFFDRECRKYLTQDENTGSYYQWFHIDLIELQAKKESSVFLKIILDAYNNNDLAYQVDKVNFCR